jgi:hypothetical protein
VRLHTIGDGMEKSSAVTIRACIKSIIRIPPG